MRARCAGRRSVPVAGGDMQTMRTAGFGGRPEGRRGLTLLELTVALAMLVVGVSAVASGLLRVSMFVRAERERNLAFEASRNVLEALQAEDFATVFVGHNATNLDDPVGLVTPGAAFDVAGLDAQAGDVDGRGGSIEFPGDGLRLLEDGFDRELGMPRDLGGADGVDFDDHALDYRVLPVIVRVRWRGASGDQEFLLAATLSNDKNEPVP
jgi:prepilin-type N-terminal cleavage/methylation domain-containing protein